MALVSTFEYSWVSDPFRRVNTMKMCYAVASLSTIVESVSCIRAVARVEQRGLILAALVCLAFAPTFRGQDAQSSSKSGHNESNGPVDLLSDTKGFNMNPYVLIVIQEVRANWLIRIPKADHHKEDM
jgi:hypothetical protein